jgi:hypothetical protein
MPFSYEDFDLSTIQTYPLKSRPSKARVDDFARPAASDASISAFIESLPNVLAAADFKAVVRAIADARRTDGGVVWGLGAHVIKTGLGPVLIDLMERGFVSAIATNGAAIGLGLGQSVTAFLAKKEPQHARSSVLAAAARLGVPVTVHVAVGTDIIHMHPAASGSAIGEGSLRDFRYFVSNVARLERGVYLNCGSAVVLPEVFLKAVALARNRGIAFAELTTVNLDFVRLYRPQTNVVARPTAGNGRGYSLVGHHEIMIPLLAAAVKAAPA